MGQLKLRQLKEEIGLVLAPVQPPQQPPPAGGLVVVHPGVVPRGQGVHAVIQGPVHQRAELDLPVAVHTGVRGPSPGVLSGEIGHDRIPEQIAKVQHRMLDAHGRRQLLGQGDVVPGAAYAASLVPRTQPQRHGVDLVSLLAQQQRRRGAVHAAAHGKANSLW